MRKNFYPNLVLQNYNNQVGSSNKLEIIHVRKYEYQKQAEKYW